MGMRDVVDALLGTEWRDLPLDESARYYLGPAYEPIGGLAKIAASMSPGADMMDMAQSSADLMASRTPWDVARNAGWLGAATLGMALPGNVGMLRGVDDTVRLYHGTTEDGMRGLEESGQFFGRPFLTPDRMVAEDYAANVGGDKDTVLAIDVPKSLLEVDFDLPGSRTLTVDDANAYSGKSGWTIDDYLKSGQSVAAPYGYRFR